MFVLRNRIILREIDIKTGDDISVHSLPELIISRDMGKRTLKEYVKINYNGAIR